ncbi:MAG: 4Fe-4S dicluster domain-containing protein [Alphaproteobacteria bacterium]|nr:4Fe-4S dicluster domain-containing protein [Alphaproteobacteria bacterium]
MPLDVEAIGKGCRNALLTTATQLCRAEVGKFQAALSAPGSLTVACTQEAPLFSEIAASHPSGATPIFANIREAAGWSNDAGRAGPKQAALLAMASEPLPGVPLVSLSSDGVVLIYGRDAQAIEAGRLLQDYLDVTVMLTGSDAPQPPRTTDFPVVRGTVRQAKGHLGKFEVTVDGYAQSAPSSRGGFRFGDEKNGTTSHCDIILDVSGTAPLFPAPDLREGYVRADPRDQAAVLRAVLKARDLVGTFDKPRYITFTEHLCAHSRSKIVGCRRCLDLCPAGAIAPDGNHVAIDAGVCAGCGQCAAACPTGAASYALPPADTLMRKLRTLLGAYRDAGGKNAVVLIHDGDHGIELIEALARFGDGLPAHVLPVSVNEVTQVGLESVAAAFAFGAGALRFLLRAKPRHDAAGLQDTVLLANTILDGIGFGSGRVATIETDDPDALSLTLRAIVTVAGVRAPATFAPAGAKRDVQRLALRELQRVSPNPVEVVALPAGAPFGMIEVNVEGCTLCLACVAACPTGALSDNPEKPMLRFAEDACVQCGLCRATCPEKVIALRPQLDFRAATSSPRVIKEEEPFCCVSCGKPFGVKSTIERVIAKLEGKHWMYRGQPQRLDVLKMCDTCRITAVTIQDFDPHTPQRPVVCTTDDYLREREAAERKGKPPGSA